MENRDFREELLPDIASLSAQAVKQAQARAEIAALNRAWALVSLRTLDVVIHARLLRYIDKLARRTGTSWSLARLTKPTRHYRAVLVSESGQRWHAFYTEGGSRPWWKRAR